MPASTQVIPWRVRDSEGACVYVEAVMTVDCLFQDEHPATQRPECRFQSITQIKGQFVPQLGHSPSWFRYTYNECPLFFSAAQLTILASALLHLQAFAQKHFRYGLRARLHCGLNELQLRGNRFIHSDKAVPEDAARRVQSRVRYIRHDGLVRDQQAKGHVGASSRMFG